MQSEVEGSAMTTSSSCCVSGAWYSGEGGFISLTSSLPFSTLRKSIKGMSGIFFYIGHTWNMVNSFIRTCTQVSHRPLNTQQLPPGQASEWQTDGVCHAHSLWSPGQSWPHTFPDMTAAYLSSASMAIKQALPPKNKTSLQNPVARDSYQRSLGVVSVGT